MLATEEARRLKYNWVGTETIILGLLNLNEGTAFHVLEEAGLTIEQYRDEVVLQIGEKNDKVDIEIPFTPGAKRSIESAWIESYRWNNLKCIGTEHLLLGIASIEDCFGTRTLKKLAPQIQIRKSVFERLGKDFIEQSFIIPESKYTSHCKVCDGVVRNGSYCCFHCIKNKE